MSHPLKGYARYVQRNASGVPSYSGALRFVQDNIARARLLAVTPHKKDVKAALVRLWNGERRGAHNQTEQQ